MSAPTAEGPAITVIGAGLAGTLLALALAQRGARVTLIGAEDDTATALSYGAVPRGRPSWAWRRLERLHGPLGWRPSGLVWHDPRKGVPGALASLSQRVPLPLARVDAPTWLAARQDALAAAGVGLLEARVGALRPLSGGGWELELGAAAGPCSPVVAEDVVLAAGAGCRRLWPSLPPRLRHSWAGVLCLAVVAGESPWLAQVCRGRIVQPRQWRRPALEATAATLERPAWIVDAGLAPWGQGAVLGQISWIPPAESPLAPPDPVWMEERLREAVARLDPSLAALHAPYRQVPVSFCADGQPLLGPVDGAPGLWAFTGFSGAFSLVPSLAEALATRVLARR